MFSSDNNINNLQQLFGEVKRYFELQKDYIQLNLLEKFIILASTMILILVLLILGMMSLFYLSFTAAYILAPAVGGLTISYAIITGFIFALGIIIFLFRKQLIIRPITKFLANLFLK